jgi:hypothetical protein
MLVVEECVERDLFQLLTEKENLLVIRFGLPGYLVWDISK